MRQVVFILVSAATVSAMPAGTTTDHPPMFQERVAAQRAIETVYWNHRIWPEQNLESKPLLDDVIPAELLRDRVEDYLAKSRALETIWQRPVTPEELQAELERMARSSRRPDMLEELFAALDHDPMLVAECLVRPRLVDRLIREAYAGDQRLAGGVPFDAWWQESHSNIDVVTDAPRAEYSLPAIAPGCTDDTWAPTPARAPSVRRGHSAVWTGSEMIVWGGMDQPSSGYLDSGGRYDPATDTWIEISTGVAGPRAGHTAVWTGTEMIVWGGYNGGYLATGARYNPTTDTWTATSTSPNQRVGHTALWTGSVMIIWGGTIGSPLENFNTGSRYDPSTNSWSATTTLGAPTGRVYHRAVWTGSEMIVWGGERPVFMGSPVFENTGGRYDPVANTWTSTGTGINLPAGRTEHAAVWTGSEMIVWGGRTGPSTYLSTGGRYDPTTNSWTPTSTGAGLPAARRFPAAAWRGSAMVVWGGDSFSGGTVYHNTGGEYDPVTDGWTATSSGAGNPSARSQHTGVWTGSQLIVWGGVETGNVHVNTGGRYVPGTNSWTATALGVDVPSGRSNHSAVWTGAEMIVWGGVATAETSTGGRYDPATNSWQATSLGANVPSARGWHTAIWTGKEMIVWGGSTGGTYHDTGGRYDPVTDGWTTTSTGANRPSARNFHTVIWTGKEMIVWGGSTNAGRFNTGGRYNPSTDAWAATSVGANVPTPRNGHSVVWTGAEMIVWGGFDTGYTNTGGRYDVKNDSWTATSTGANVPPLRGGHTAEWTGSRMVVWGGYYFPGSTVYLNTGGRYDPATNTWTATGTGGGVPGARGSHSSVWTRKEMIVWGGWDGINLFKTGGRYDPVLDSWTATGTGANTPFARSVHSAVWADGEMIVWGGVYGPYQFTSGARYCACSYGVPSVPPVLQIAKPTLGSTTARLTWLAVPEATGYDVVTGQISTLRSSAGDFSVSTTACLAQNQSATTVDDPSSLASGDGVWYLLRGVSCAGNGSYDSGGAQQSGQRDAEVQASGCACP